MFLSVWLVAPTAHRSKLDRVCCKYHSLYYFVFLFCRAPPRMKHIPDDHTGARLAASCKLHAPFNVSSPVQWNSFICRHAQAECGELHPLDKLTPPAMSVVKCLITPGQHDKWCYIIKGQFMFLPGPLTSFLAGRSCPMQISGRMEVGQMTQWVLYPWVLLGKLYPMLHRCLIDPVLFKLC